MASRDYIKHLVSNTVPTSIGVGDEYFDPGSNKLFKRLAFNGANVTDLEIVLQEPDNIYQVIDNRFTLSDDSDPSKKGQFNLSALGANTTVVYTLPTGSSNSSTLIDDATSQSMFGQKTFSGTLIATGGTIQLSGTTLGTTTTTIGTNATTGTTTIGGTLSTGVITIDQSISTHTLNISVGAAGSGNTKTINFGTTGLAGSITNINFGSSVVNAQGVATFDTRIVANEQVSVANTTAATSVSTGAITTTGGISAAGNIYSANIYTTGIYYAANGLPYAMGGGGGSVSITNDTATNLSTFYPLLSNNVTSGSLSTANTSSTKLYFNPSTGTLFSTNFNTSSDVSLKTEVETIQNALETVQSLRGVGFKWIDNGLKSYGVIAQEVEQQIPELVNTMNGTKSVNYDAFVGFLIEAMKQQSNTIKTLEERIVKLENK